MLRGPAALGEGAVSRLLCRERAVEEAAEGKLGAGGEAAAGGKGARWSQPCGCAPPRPEGRGFAAPAGAHWAPGHVHRGEDTSAVSHAGKGNQIHNEYTLALIKITQLGKD